MRDHFDPLTPLFHQNHYQPNPYEGNHMQGQIYHHHQQPSKVVSSSTQNPFGNDFSNTTGFSTDITTTTAPNPTVNVSVGEKRNSGDENVDCNMLQSSLKRVRLSRSPGEFRLQRDLKTLEPMKWGSSHAASNALNFAATTWIHRNTGARLTMVDSLRICLFLPMTAMQPNRKFDPQHQYQHQHHSYHRDYRWRIMIQIPRMYPHSPPVVTRIEGLSLDAIAINEMPPGVPNHPNDSRNDNSKNDNDGGTSVRSTTGVTTSESCIFTESQLARSTSCKSIASTEAQNGSSAPSVVGNSIGKVIQWNQWSPITGLGELLEFVLEVAESNMAATPLNSMMTSISTTMNESKTSFEPSMALMKSGMSASSSSSLSSVSSASSISSWGKRFSINHESDRAASFFNRGGGNTVAETVMSDENATTISTRTNLSGESFLSPNRFDMGYGKSGAGDRFAGTTGVTPRTANTTAWQQHLQFRGKQQGDDDGMDIS